MPISIQFLERAIFQSNAYPGGWLPHIGCRKTLFDIVIIDMYGCLYGIALNPVHTGATAPRQKLRIVGNIIDQREHLLCAVGHQYRLFNLSHANRACKQS